MRAIAMVENRMRYIICVLSFFLLSNALINGQTQPDLSPITPENIDRLTQLRVVGRGSITALALSSNEKHLAVGTKAGVWMYETADFSKEPVFLPHPDWVAEIAFSPDDLTLAVIGFNDSVRVWSVPDQALIWELNSSPEIGWFRQEVAFDVNGTTITSVSDAQVIVAETTTGREIKRFTLYQDSPVVTSLSLSQDGTLLAIAISTNLGGRLDLWDTQSEELLWSAEVKPSIPAQNPFVIWSLAFHPIMPMLAAGTNSGEISLWNIETGEVIDRISERFAVTDLHFSNEGNYLVAATSGGFIHFWDMINGGLYSAVENRVGTALLGYSYLAISKNAEIIYAAGADDRLMIWERDNQTFNLVNILDDFGATYSDTTLAYMSEENVVLTATGDPASPFANRIHAWSLSSSQEVFTLPDFDFVAELFVAGDVIIGRNGSIKFWSYSTQELILTLDEYEGQPFYPSDTALTSNGDLLAITESSDYYGDGTSHVYVWDLKQQRFIAKLSLEVDFIEGAVFNPVDDQLGFVTRNIESNTVEVMFWDYLDSASPYSVVTTTSAVLAIEGLMAFHPNGNRMVYHGDNAIRLYDFTNQKSTPVMELSQNTLVMNLAFSQGGELIAVGILDATVIVSIADEDNPSVVANLPGLKSMFIEDDTRLLTVGYDGVIHVWGIPNP